MYGGFYTYRVKKIVEGFLGFDTPSDRSRAWTPLMRSGSNFENYYRRAPDYRVMGCPYRISTSRRQKYNSNIIGKVAALTF